MGERGFTNRFKKLAQGAAFMAGIGAAAPHSAEAAPSTPSRETASQEDRGSSIEQWKSELQAAAAKVDTQEELNGFFVEYTQPLVREFYFEKSDGEKTAEYYAQSKQKAEAMKAAYERMKNQFGQNMTNHALAGIDNIIGQMDDMIAKCSPEDQAAREQIQRQMDALKKSGY